MSSEELEKGGLAVLSHGPANIHDIYATKDSVVLDLVVNNYNDKERTFGIYDIVDYDKRLFRRSKCLRPDPLRLIQKQLWKPRQLVHSFNQ